MRGRAGAHIGRAGAHIGRAGAHIVNIPIIDITCSGPKKIWDWEKIAFWAILLGIGFFLIFIF